MKTIIKNKNTITEKDHVIILSDKKTKISSISLNSQEKKFIKEQQKENKEIIILNQYTRKIIVVNPKKINNYNLYLENLRCLGDKVFEEIKGLGAITINTIEREIINTYAFVEGMALSNYKFTNHKSKKEKEQNLTIYIYKNANSTNISEIERLAKAVRVTKDLVNTPFSHLKATDLARLAKEAGKNSGYKTTVFNKKKIQSLKMGGLLAVNQGSIDEPTFSILEWKPKNSKNKKPIILVGKGIVYDTGGLSLKPTKGMDIMKVDMAGAGTVIGAMHAIASNKIPKHVIGLVPATDNRPSGNAYAPGDVVTMFNKSTVEVLNTDAEGRMILADALSYAQKYNPELVIDLATLTGAAARAIGHFGIVSMQKNAKKYHEKLEETGHKTHERLAEMPFWDDYDELIKSDIADIKNIGGPFAGAITAGKFLSNFIDYPWIHLDIAGPAYVTSKYGYRGKGATGMGVRLLYEFVKKH
jgi:leucyl aminopeptidase